MTLTKLTLAHFRHFSKQQFTFSPKITVLVGPNGSGKTNTLEAVFLLATGKSFRAQHDTEAIEFGAQLARVRGLAQQSGSPEKIDLELVITRGEVMGIATQIKKYQVNGISKRMVDFVGKLKVVLFWPQDLELVTNSPSRRRKYLDFVLTQVDREYRRNLVSYEKGLRQRNRVLEAIRDKGAHLHQLLFWDQLLIKAGSYLEKKREEYIEHVNKSLLFDFAQGAKSEDMEFHMIYDKSVISEARLAQYKEEEVAAGVTLVGPHRDDIVFQIKTEKFQKVYENLSQFGSRGEQRLCILWLKLAELAYIEQSTGEKPLLLLDDIFSELDKPHRELIFGLIENQQTILTTTEKEIAQSSKLSQAKIIFLE